MKKYMGIFLSVAVTVALSNAAFADGNAFTPLNFDDSASTPAVKQAKTTPAAKSSSPFSNALAKLKPAKAAETTSTTTGGNAVGNENIQNAILELDNAQVGIRDQLVDYKAKYSDVDSQYKLIKNERAMLHRQVSAVEKRIRDLDKQKNALRKNML